MQVIRTPNEAKEILSSLKDGEETTFNYNPKFRIMKIPEGFIYSSDYNGMCFVPESHQSFTQAMEAPKAEPKKGGRPPKVMTK